VFCGWEKRLFKGGAAVFGQLRTKALLGCGFSVNADATVATVMLRLGRRKTTIQKQIQQ